MVSARLDENKNPAVELVSTKVNGFQLNAKDVILNATAESETSRVSYEFLDDNEKRRQRSYCHTLTKEFLADHEKASSCIGTKTSRLIEEIKEMIQNKSGSKCVVFSQFLGTLDVAAQELFARDIRFVRVDGNMKQHQRADALHDFSSNPATKVFLLSMRAGAAGLNLIAADHCFILDACPNTAIEEQAIDRLVERLFRPCF